MYCLISLNNLAHGGTPPNISENISSFDRSPPGILPVLKTSNRSDTAGEACSSSDHILNKFK